MKLRYLIIGYSLFFSPNYFLQAQNNDTTQNEKYSFIPSIGGGQVEVSSLIYVTEYGALMDIDLFKKESKFNYSFGARISFEVYGYFEPGGPTDGGPFKDYCFFIMHSTRNEDIHINFLCGIAYHTRNLKLQRPDGRLTIQRPDETLIRTGFEFRYNLYDKIIGILLKVSTSFDKKNTFAGLGIAFGFYE